MTTASLTAPLATLATPMTALRRLVLGYVASVEASRLLRLSDVQLAARGLTRESVVVTTFARHGLH
ncbi:MAG: hypothetical protein AAFQ51_03415 [Pseudomonadota bacterium]